MAWFYVVRRSILTMLPLSCCRIYDNSMGCDLMMGGAMNMNERVMRVERPAIRDEVWYKAWSHMLTYLVWLLLLCIFYVAWLLKGYILISQNVRAIVLCWLYSDILHIDTPYDLAPIFSTGKIQSTNILLICKKTSLRNSRDHVNVPSNVSL